MVADAVVQGEAQPDGCAAIEEEVIAWEQGVLADKEVLELFAVVQGEERGALRSAVGLSGLEAL